MTILTPSKCLRPIASSCFMVFARRVFFSLARFTLLGQHPPRTCPQSTGQGIEDALFPVYRLKDDRFSIIRSSAPRTSRIRAQELVVAKLADLISALITDHKAAEHTCIPHWHGLKLRSERSSGSAQRIQSGSSCGVSASCSSLHTSVAKRKRGGPSAPQCCLQARPYPRFEGEERTRPETRLTSSSLQTTSCKPLSVSRFTPPPPAALAGGAPPIRLEPSVAIGCWPVVGFAGRGCKLAGIVK